MNKIIPVTVFIISFLLAAWATARWGIVPWPISVLHGTDETAAEIIHRTMPSHIVSPEWLGLNERKSEGITTWIVMESRVRIGMIWGTLILVLGILIVHARRQLAANKPA